jgi:ABC-2 type transport system permease protein
MRTERSIVGLAWREVRRGALIVVAAAAGLLFAFMAAFSATATGAAAGASAAISTLTDNPAIRALYGVPVAIDTRGGFAVWRGTLMILTLTGLWALLTSTKVLRGEEESGRWDLVLAQPLRRTTTTLLHVTVLSVVALAIGAAVALTFLAGGCPASGSILYGAGVGLFAWTFVALGSVASQVFGSRRIASGACGAILGASAVLRMAADSSSANEWIRWLTPYGWVEQLQAFGANNPGPLVLLALTPCVLIALAMILAHRRDLGEGIVRTKGTARSRPRLLRSPLGLAWRQRLGGLAGWSTAMLFYGMLMGAITGTFTEFIAANESFQHLAAQVGMTGLTTPAGFITSGTGFLAVAFTIYGVSSLGKTHEDEVEGRLDLPYAQPVTRSKWLGSQVAVIALAVFIAMSASVLATWVGAAISNAGLSFHDVAVATLNVMPAAAVFFGLAVLLFGVRPSLAVPLGAGAAIAAYAVSFIGPALHWPSWALDLSVFHALGNAPVSPVAWTAVIILIAITIVELIGGFFGYRRRDLA